MKRIWVRIVRKFFPPPQLRDTNGHMRRVLGVTEPRRDPLTAAGDRLFVLMNETRDGIRK